MGKKEKSMCDDNKQKINDRAMDLLSQMALEEKVDQLRSQMITPDQKRERDYKAGHVRTPAHFIHKIMGRQVTPSECARLINQDQKNAIESNRLGIPVLHNCESLHGAQWGSATCFPQAIALASTWNTSLMSRVAESIAKELRAVGVRQVFAPVVNIARDSRWGRTQETYGEDTYLTSRMAVAYVKALEEMNVVATPKHFAANVGDGGRDSNAVGFSERLLREVYLPAFEACIREGGARSVMAAYNSIDGMPCTCNKWLLTDILRKEWGFEGFVVTDYCGMNGIYGTHSVAKNHQEALKMALEAGLDVELPNGGGMLLELVNTGKLSQNIIDECVFRVIKTKLELGLFDQPYVDAEAADKIVRCMEHRELALQAARESIVLLKNQKKTLPLNRHIGKIGIFGPTKDTLSLGDYSGPYGGWIGDGVSPLEGIRKIISDDARILVHHEEDNPVEIAKECDVAVIFTAIYETEGADRSCLDLPGDGFGENAKSSDEDLSHGFIVDEWQRDLRLGNQEQLIKDIAGTGVPTIVVLINGSTVTMNKWINGVDAVVEAWYPGEQGGTAIAEVLFGEYNPGGRLPLTFPKTVGQMPLYYNYKPSGRTYSYIENDGEPAFPFGFGLSYTEFIYDNLRIYPEKAGINEEIEILVDIGNIGSLKGDEVVQLYLRDEVASLARPLKELKGFDRITLEPGEKTTVKFVLRKDDLAMWNKDIEFVVEPGWFKVMIGSSSKDIRVEGLFEIVMQ